MNLGRPSSPASSNPTADSLTGSGSTGIDAYQRFVLQVKLLDRLGKAAGIVLALAVRLVAALLIHPELRRFAILHTRERLKVKAPYAGVDLVCDGPNLNLRRLVFPRKETETLDWISRMKPGEVLWDIGAHVGFVTLPAAQRGVMVYAIEPMPANFAALCENIRVNRFGDRVVPLCMSLYCKKGLTRLHISGDFTGASMNTVGNEAASVPPQGAFLYSQTVVSMTADALLADLSVPSPNFMKLDVDGNEHDILIGADAVLMNPSLREILIELDSEAVRLSGEIVGLLARYGFQQISTHAHGRFSNALFTRIAAA
jgi:FkbM family methyltransferase